jgi:pSer/pThr/pTyr-binding forkhead associated (FHA) protein
MQVVLVMFRADGERRSFSVVRDITVLGRREDCDLRIPLGDVSRKHCRIIRSGDNVRLEDLGSSNGTLRNGERITSVDLQPGDTIVLGPVTFVVQINGLPADDKLKPHRITAAGSGDATSVVGVPLDTLDEIEPALEELHSPDNAANTVSTASPKVSGNDDNEDLVSLEPAEEIVADTGAKSRRDHSRKAEHASPPAASAGAAKTKKEASKAEKGKKTSEPAASAKTTAAPADPLVIEGELQASDQFEGVVDGAEFDIVLDDIAQESSGGEIQIDWNPESQA